MGSPRIEVFFVFNETTGAPLAGLTPTFLTYKDDLGVNVAQPAITEIGGGAYKFTPVFADTNRGLVYMIDSGAGSSPRYTGRFMRAEDWAADNILKFLKNKWKIHTSGAEANRLVVYDDDGTTVLYRFELLDANGSLSPTDPFTRQPV